MRCPKCHYLSFEPEPRCRNCGYDTSFEPGELVVKPAAPAEQTLEDLDLRIHEHETPAMADTFAAAAPVLTTELPLFVQGLKVESSEPDVSEIPEIIDEPLVKLPAAPRVPLSVRRPTPAPGRVREKYQSAARAESARQVGLLERDLLESAETPWPLIGPDPTPLAPAPEPTPEAPFERVGAGKRLEAASVDVLFIGSINAAIVWLTLQTCGLTLSQIGLLPILPIAALLFLLDTLYLLMFTATNGQTVGKMAAGIRVVGDDATDRVTFKQAILRAVLTFPSVLVLGAGFVPALMGRGLALHDRFTHTRVVRA
jgi:uncharacterized RDD family membrane protein YckC